MLRGKYYYVLKWSFRQAPTLRAVGLCIQVGMGNVAGQRMPGCREGVTVAAEMGTIEVNGSR